MSFLKFGTTLKLLKTKFNGEAEYTGDVQEETNDIREANTISSELPNGNHYILLDLDVPHHYEPSSTEGYGHLYIAVELVPAQYSKLMFFLKNCGIIQPGYYNQLTYRGHNTLRLPRIKKGGE